MRPFRTSILLSALLCLAAAPWALADDQEELFAAARAGRLDEVKRLVESGVPVDATDKYGTSAMMMAATSGRPEVVGYLLEKGADPSRKETFYGTTALGWMSFSGTVDEAAMREIALLLLKYGTEDRGQVLGMAIQEGDVELARAAVESGPFYESVLGRYTAGARNMDPALKEILDQAETRPDLAPPSYTADELGRFTGRYQDFVSDRLAEVALDGDGLTLAIDGGEAKPLQVTGEQSFETEDGGIANFFGRAGTVAGIQLMIAGLSPMALRRSVAEPLGAEAFTGGSSTADIAAAEPTVHWPAFRGSAASGVGDGLDTRVEWSVESGEGVLWSAEVPGLGNSSPVVWGDRIFVTTAVAEAAEQKIRTGLTGAGDPVDESVEHRWLVMAFDKHTGERLWETEVGSAVPLTKRHFKATQANSTPVTDGEHLVVVFPTAGMACLDLEGKILWKHELGGLNAGAFSDPTVEWGFASSPFLYDSMVIQQVDVHGGQYIAAWDLESGEEVWRTERSVAPSWATPNILPGPKGDELVVNGSTIHGYDPKTGKELWSLAPNSELVIATPVIGDGRVYVSAGYPPVKPIYAIEAGLRGAHEVDPRAGDESLAWSHGIGGAYMPTPLLYNDILYVVHHNGRIVAYDAATGAAIYKNRFSKGGTFTGSPVAVNGKLYAGTEEGRLYVLEAGPEYKELAVNDMKEPLMATPAISEGVLLVRTPSRLTAIGDASSEEAGL